MAAARVLRGCSRILNNLVQGCVQDFALFRLVDVRIAGSRTGGRWPAEVAQRAVEHLRKQFAHMPPGAHIARFFLDPAEFFRRGEARGRRLELFGAERVELFDPDDGRVRLRLFAAPRQEIVIDFAAAPEQPPDLRRRFRIGDDGLKSPIDQFIQA